MAFSRTAALRSCFRAARPTIARPQLLRQVARRGYASGGHGSAQAGGDAVWAAGAVAVTVPTCWYLLSNAPDTSHGHDSHGESHGKEHKEEAEESTEDGGAKEKSEDSEKTKPEGSEEKKDDSAAVGSEDSDSGDEKEADTPDTSDDENDIEPTAKTGGNTRKHNPDAKVGAKARLESNKGIKLGEAAEEGSDKAAASKPAENHNTQTGKQEGLTNTDTKHSIDITSDLGKSNKGEGAPDAAKLKGTVDPKRPQV